MIELKGSLRERIDDAMRLASETVGSEEWNRFTALYAEAKVMLLSSAEDFYRKYGGAFSQMGFAFEDSGYNKEFVFSFFSDLLVSESEKIQRLREAAEETDRVEKFANQRVCPVAEIGFYYPPVVYIGENALLYCIHDYEDEIRVFATPEEILEYELLAHIPIGLTERGES